MHNDLMKLVTMEEVKFAIFSMDSYKAPSVDGFQSIFMLATQFYFPLKFGAVTSRCLEPPYLPTLSNFVA